MMEKINNLMYHNSNNEDNYLLLCHNYMCHSDNNSTDQSFVCPICMKRYALLPQLRPEQL